MLRQLLRLGLPCLLLLFSAASLGAATLNVTNTADEADGSCLDGDCSLRDAVASAAPGDTIALPAGDYLLSLGQIVLDKNLVLAGAGARATVLRGNGSARHFTVQSGRVVTLADLTLTAGRANFGGSIDSAGNLTLRRVSLANNRADFAGAINSNGTLTLIDSAVIGNSANSVGGVYSDVLPIFVENSTISGNTANLLAGGLAMFGPARLNQATIAFNTVTQTQNWQGGGVFFAGETTLVGVLLEGNSPANCDAVPPTAVGSFDSDGSCALGGGNLSGVPAELAALADNGGPTDTHALPAGSPAIDFAGACSTPADQRGVLRPQGAGCDSGAFERGGGPAGTTVCQREDFSTGLGSLDFDFVGDADQGGASNAGGRLRLTSDGSAFYHGSDNGGFLHRSVSGDFRVEVVLEGFPSNTGGGYRRSGLTVRSGTGPNDPRVYVELLPQHPVYGQPALMFDYRGDDGVARELGSTKLGLAAPLRLAIDRRGNRFTVWYSADGINWVKPAGAAGGSVVIAMPESVEVGLMQASYEPAVTLTTEFDDLEICQPSSEALPPLPPPVACVPGQPLDLVYLVDASGSSPSAFPGGPTQMGAARQAIARLNDLVETGLPGSRAALVTYQGGPAPAYSTGAGATLRSPFSANLGNTETAAAAINPGAINPTTSSPLSQGLAAARELLAASGAPGARPVVVLLGDGFVNVDAAGHGPASYKTAEMQAMTLFAGGSYRTIGETGWLGNWNGPIHTWDGEALAGAMAEGLFLKELLPGASIEALGIHGAGNYRDDLLRFLADYSAGTYAEATSAAGVETGVDAIYAGLACHP